MSFRKLSAGLLTAAWGWLASCGPRVTTIAQYDAEPGHYVEAESGKLSGPFVIANDQTASAGRFIYANEGVTFDTVPGNARAEYELTADSGGTYQIWGRIHGQDVDSNRFWFQVDGGAWVLWRITTGDVWFWSYFHDNLKYVTRYTVKLSAGTHRLVIANSVDNTGLDRLYYAPDESEPENNQTMCNPPNSVQLNGACNASCGALAGTGHCIAGPCTTGAAPVVTYDCARCCAPAK